MFDHILENQDIHLHANGTATVRALIRRGDNTPMLQSHVSSWDFFVYDVAGETPEDPFFSEEGKTAAATNADTTPIIKTAVVTSAVSPTSAGHNFEHVLSNDALDLSPGRAYTLTYVFRQSGNAGTIEISVPLICDGGFR